MIQLIFLLEMFLLTMIHQVLEQIDGGLLLALKYHCSDTMWSLNNLSELQFSVAMIKVIRIVK